jgi:hypothetical protein
MNAPLNPKTQFLLKNHGVIAYTPSRLVGILSFLLTGGLFTAVLLLTLKPAFGDEREEARHHRNGNALPCVMARARSSLTSTIVAAQRTEPMSSHTKPLSQPRKAL